MGNIFGTWDKNMYALVVTKQDENRKGLSWVLIYFQFSGDTKSISQTKTVHLSGAVTDIAYSPSGAFVVTADANRKVTLFNADYEKAHAREWGFHTAKVWIPNVFRFGFIVILCYDLINIKPYS